MSLYEENILTDERALERFWAKIEIPHPEDPDACWNWTAKKDKNSCGIFGMYCPQLEGLGVKAWRSFRAPRLMWVLENDRPIPEGLLVIHSCDSEFCCNRLHLRLGTHKDNANDRRLRGRYDTGLKGEKHPRAILTVAKVRKICHLYFTKGMSLSQIAKKLEIVQPLVWRVVTGRSWKHVTKTHIPKGFLHKFQKCANRNEKMYKAFKDGWTYQKISDHYKISIEYTREILRKMRKEHGDKPTPIGFQSTDRRGYK